MNLKNLESYLPEGSLPLIQDYLEGETLIIRVTRPRKSRYGMFRPAVKNKKALITIGAHPNSYQFLITLVHEIAHLKIWNKFRKKVKPHGDEWKKLFSDLMKPFIQRGIFPESLISPLEDYLKNPYSTILRHPELSKKLAEFDRLESGHIYLEDLPDGAKFLYNGQRTFIKVRKMRTRYLCLDSKTRRRYAFNPLAEVIPL